MFDANTTVKIRPGLYQFLLQRVLGLIFSGFLFFMYTNLHLFYSCHVIFFWNNHNSPNFEFRPEFLSIPFIHIQKHTFHPRAPALAFTNNNNLYYHYFKNQCNNVSYLYIIIITLIRPSCISTDKRNPDVWLTILFGIGLI